MSNLSTSSLQLLKKKRFLPVFLTMFLGSFNDNLFKNGLIILATFNSAYATAMGTPQLAALASGIFVLPFFLFSSTAGQMADKYEKSFLVRRLKYTELAFMLLAVAGFYLQHTWFLVFVLFCMGAQSAFFGPIKYSILPDHLRQEELVAGNALVEAATFLSILFGTSMGGLVVMAPQGETILSVLVLGVAVLGIVASRFIPQANPHSPELPMTANIVKSTAHVMSYAWENRPVFLCIVGIAWFWFVGATFVSQFPPYVRDHIGGNEEVVTVFLAAFSIGVAGGALLCGRVLKGEVSARTVPYAMVGVALSIAAVVLLSDAAHPPQGALMGAREFFMQSRNLLLFGALVMLAGCAGFVSVPLFAVMQSKSIPSHRARVISASNITDALFMVTSSVLAMALLGAGASIPQLFAVVAGLCLPVAWILRGVEKA